MSDLINLTIADAREKLKKKEISAKELAAAHIKETEKQRGLNAYITETPEIALAAAEESDKRIAAGGAGVMEGIPVGVKDLFCTKDVKTTAASKILYNFVPPYESTVSGKLAAAGGVMIGKTNMDEFAMGSANLTSYFGAVKNPWKRKGDDKDLTPGGSSGGSAAAVAAKTCMGALGSDTGGSIRQPAAFCGVVGVKPTYGRCSRFGMVAFASSLDQAGVFTRTVRDSAIMLQAICGHDPKDSTSAKKDVPVFENAVGKSVKGMRIGIPKEYRMDGMPQEINDLWAKGAEWLKEAGAEIVEISLPHTKYSLPTYYIIAPAEASSNLSRYDGMRFGYRAEGTSLQEVYEKTRAEGFGAEVKRRIMIGTYVLSAGYYDAYYKKAQKLRTLITKDFLDAFGKVDAILTPTTPSTAFALDHKVSDPVEMYLNDVFTVTVNLAGLPGISVPAGIADDGLPLGLQLIGKHFDEETLFAAAGAIEQAAGFKGI